MRSTCPLRCTRRTCRSRLEHVSQANPLASAAAYERQGQHEVAELLATFSRRGAALRLHKVGWEKHACTPPAHCVAPAVQLAWAGLGRSCCWSVQPQ